MTSPYTPEFEFEDWPNGPLNANLPPAPQSPNAVLHRVEQEFGNVAAAFTELAAADDAISAQLGGMRAVINALLAGRQPTTPALPQGAYVMRPDYLKAAGDDSNGK